MGSILKFKLKKDELLMLLVVYLYIALCPFNKVEESFNTQAIHDMIYNTKYLYYYDHISFPGVVPRTFIGALSVALPTGLVHSLTRCSKAVTYTVARMVLGLYVVWSFSTFRRAVKNMFGSKTGNCLLVLTCTQFHFLFYASRTLPNIFALCCVLVAVAYWLNKSWDGFLWSSGLAVLIFRSELLMLLGPMILLDICSRTQLLKDLINPGLQIAAVLLVVSCSIDTYMWRYTVWPELKVLYYNTWLNKSKDWGTLPFLWYIYSALPRAMLLGLPLAVIGCLTQRRILNFCFPALAYIALYSLLPHKELRFILYTVPMLNVAGAHVMSRLWERNILTKLLVVGGLLVNLIGCSVFLSASYHNYPGGAALDAVHNYASCDQNTTVYIGNFAAQNGASRFGERCDSLFERRWNYVKTENLALEHLRQIKLLLVEPKDAPKFKLTHAVVEKFYAFNKLKFHPVSPFIHTEKREAIYLMKSKTIRKERIIIRSS